MSKVIRISDRTELELNLYKNKLICDLKRKGISEEIAKDMIKDDSTIRAALNKINIIERS